MRRIPARALRRTASATVVVQLVIAATACARGEVSDLRVFNDNGAWSWFEDERAIVDVDAGKIIVSSVANGAGPGGADRHGDVDVAALDLATGRVERFTLSEGLQADDHDSAALWRRPDGRYVAMYCKHGSDQWNRYRISTRPSDISQWSTELMLDNAGRTTYSNLHYLADESGGAGRLYNFTRAAGFDPHLWISDDHGDSWTYGGPLLVEGSRHDRPYLRYASNGKQIHLLSTDRHPRNYDNSIYHGYIENDRLHNSRGEVVDESLLGGDAVAPSALTAVFLTGSSFDGTTMRRGWTVDVAIDATGQPYAVFQARANDDPLDHRYFYGRFDGDRWSVHPLAKAGGYLYAGEPDYTGLVALDPNDPDRLYLSTKIDPRSDADLAHYEIFLGVTADRGATWQWTPITQDSSADNLRPIVPAWDTAHTALLWMRGTYSTYVSYNLEIVGRIDERSPAKKPSPAQVGRQSRGRPASAGIVK